MVKLLLRMFLLLSIAVLIAGCKLAVINVEGGSVLSDVSGTCVAGNICIVDVAQPDFSETFTAVPDTGWYFQKWNSGHGFFCGGSTDFLCRLSLEGIEDNAVREKLLASSATFYLMPVFKAYKDIVTVNDKQWLQPSLFLNLSWHEINAVCPKGICAGVLNGYDMTGWLWASVNDMNTLFNHYIGADILGPGPSGFYHGDAPNSSWASDFYGDGWRPTNGPIVYYPSFYYCPSTTGWASDEAIPNCFDDCHYTPSLADSDEIAQGFFCSSGARTNIGDSINGSWQETGAWFYRAL